MSATSRRAMLLAAAAAAIPADAQSGDPEWTRKFQKFLKQLNLFIIDLNDGLMDVRKWKKVEEAWAELERR